MVEEQTEISTLTKWQLFKMNHMLMCPQCSHKLDDNYHGLQNKWLHCHNCKFCTYDRYWERTNKEIKDGER